MVDVGRGAEPQLRAVLPAREHHGEVVLAGDQQLPLLLLAQLRDAADQVGDVLALGPVLGGYHLGPDLALHAVSVEIIRCKNQTAP